MQQKQHYELCPGQIPRYASAVQLTSIVSSEKR
jgi:hypothetical protein